MKPQPVQLPPAPDDTLRIAPDPPAWLGELAAAEWRRVAPVLARRGVLTVDNVAVLEAYVGAYERLRLASEALSAGAVYELPNGCLAARPEVAIEARSRDQVRRLAAELGLTPASRKKAGAAAPFADARARMAAARARLREPESA